MPDSPTIFFSLAGGILPALFWLWFWLREDQRRPEPRGYIMLAFFGGMLATIAALFLEHETKQWVGTLSGFFGGTTFLFLLWAATEEIVKFIAAYFTSLRFKKKFDEPIDAVIYLITTALGFSATENVLYLIQVISDGDTTQSIITGDFRFIGASLLHTFCSALIGFVLAFVYYKGRKFSREMVFAALVAAIGLHFLFNITILLSDGENLLLALSWVWLGIIGLILLFEKAKKIRPKSFPKIEKIKL